MSSLGTLGGLAASEHDEEVAKEELAVRVLFELERVPDVKYDWGGMGRTDRSHPAEWPSFSMLNTSPPPAPADGPTDRGGEEASFPPHQSPLSTPRAGRPVSTHWLNRPGGDCGSVWAHSVWCLITFLNNALTKCSELRVRN